MMSITLICPHCQEKLHLAKEMAGRVGACRHCGGTINVPAESSTGSSGGLEQASVDQIIDELSRRGVHALVTLVNPVGETLGNPINPLREALRPGATLRVSVKHMSTAGLTPDECRTVLAMLSQLRPPAQKPPVEPPAPAPAPQEPPKQDPTQSEENFSFKGDPLGMKLSEFKMKHERMAPGRRSRMPWCSDESPNSPLPGLMYEPWQARIGVVHARIDMPDEHNSPTIGGAATEAVIYQFVDERLFQVTGFFATDDFPKVSKALRSKYDDPQCEEHQPYRLQWWRGDSTIELTQGRIHPREPSIFRLFHDDMLADASKRKPDTTADL